MGKILVYGYEAMKQETLAKGASLRKGEECYLVKVPFRNDTFLIYLEYVIYPKNPNSTDQTGWNYVIEYASWCEYSRGQKPYSYETMKECYDIAWNLINAYMAGHNAGTRPQIVSEEKSVSNTIEIPVVTLVNTHNWNDYEDKVKQEVLKACTPYREGINQDEATRGYILIHSEYAEKARAAIEALGYNTNEMYIEHQY